MTQAKTKQITFEDFVDWKPKVGRYELHDGAIVEIQPTGEHEEIAGFLARKLTVEFDRLNLPYFIPNQALIKALDSESAYLPDIWLLDKTALTSEPLWQKSSTVTKFDSIPLVVEIVSTNWRDDYFRKVGDYEAIGIPEYWIVDYLGLGGRRFIGNSKQPTVSVYYLVEGEYQINQFRGSDRIQSPTFPELNLTLGQIFQARLSGD